jgi:DNA-binding FadR family transcriptional regulator
LEICYFRYYTGHTGNTTRRPKSFSSETAQKKISDLQEVREVIEPTIAALAAKNAKAEYILKMERSINAMERQKFNSNPYIQAANNFHIALAEACNNNVFLLLVNSCEPGNHSCLN